MASSYWTCLFILPLFSNGDIFREEESKRLLLTDPNALLSRMEALERKVQSMEGLERKVQALETQLNSDRKTGNYTIKNYDYSFLYLKL